MFSPQSHRSFDMFEAFAIIASIHHTRDATIFCDKLSNIFAIFHATITNISGKFVATSETTERSKLNVFQTVFIQIANVSKRLSQLFLAFSICCCDTENQFATKENRSCSHLTAVCITSKVVSTEEIIV